MKNQNAVALGSITSERKAVSSRENGKRGGRPRKPREILLTQGKVALVDAEDYEELMKWKWIAFKSGKTHYAVRHSPHDPITHKNHLIFMHRVIMDTPKGMQTDHINGDGLDNRRNNLRICTVSENQMNRGANRNNASGFKGIFFNKPQKKWVAVIMVAGIRKNLGSFTTPEAAHKAYCEACIKNHGDFANYK